MTTDPYFPPPPYTPSDPLTPATTQASESPPRLRRGDGQVPVYSPTPANVRVGEEPPTFDHAPDSPHFSSAATYFEERGLRVNTYDDVILHHLFISSADTAEDVGRIPLCWRNRTNDLTEADMRTFANFLLPPGANFGLPTKLRANIASDEKAPLSPTDTETNAERRARMSLVIAEWNEAFFYPRGLLVELVFIPQHPPHAARGLDPICQSCVAANNSASRYAAQTYHQPLHPHMPHGMGIPPPPPLPPLPPLPQIPHGRGMFPHGLPPVPPMLPHGPGVFPHGFPPHAPFGRRPFGLNHLRNGIERLASGRGRSRASGPGRGEHCARSGELHSFDHGHHTFHHHHHCRSRSSSSSSSSSSSDSDHHHRRAARHGGSSRGRGRERGRGEACERRHERYHRRRERSSSASSSSSSSSDSSIDSISSRDVRGLKLEDVIRGIAAARLGKEGEKFGAKMDDMGKKIGFRMEEIGRKIDAKIAVKQLKSGLKEMKRENGNSGRGISKDEKKAVKRELKGLKKDLKDQMREVKREKKELKREERCRRRDRRRHGRDGGRRSERRSRGCEGTERGEEDGEGAARADMEGQVTGVTPIQDTNPGEWGNDVKS